MAIQTLTTTVTGKETSTNVAGDTNANGDPFGGNGPTPLIPAFLLSALLIVGVMMVLWYRRLARRGVTSFGIATGADVPALAFHGTTAVDLPSKLGPIPRIWDVYLAGGFAGSDNCRGTGWRDINPLSASSLNRLHPSPCPSSDRGRETRSDIARHLHFTSRRRWMFRQKKAPDISIPSLDRSPSPTRLQVTVLIAMPCPSRRSYAFDGPNVESKPNKTVFRGSEDPDIVLGITGATFTRWEEGLGP